MSKGVEIELENEGAIIMLPENSVLVEITAHVYMNDEIIKVGKVMNMKEIKSAFDEYKIAEETGYIHPDTVFGLTDKGKKLAEDMNEE